MHQHPLRSADALAEFTDEFGLDAVHAINRDAVVVGVGHVNAAVRVKIDIVRSRLVIGTEFTDEFEGHGIEYHHPVVTDIGNEQVFAVRRQFQIVRIFQRHAAFAEILELDLGGLERQANQRNRQ